MQRVNIHIRGAVQGVGFRPFVYRIARSLGLTGWVRNAAQGVFIEAEGPNQAVQKFLYHLEFDRPIPAKIYSLKYYITDPAGYKVFKIEQSKETGEKSAWILPDIATCSDCLADIFDPDNRRYLYPFTNCTHCGPRFTIVEHIPYDRSNTTMKKFRMCPVCRKEYKEPSDRRFHAQPNACPACGPYIELSDAHGKFTASRHKALEQCVVLLQNGQIVAVKGLGGFHLMADAANENAVQLLRQRKHRDEKPFAVMMNAPDAERCCRIGLLEKSALHSPEAPIVLLKKKQRMSCGLAENIAPHNPWLGVMLPYTPLHHILLRQFGRPLVATSANLSDETICIDNDDALNRLASVADAFLWHNRPIARHADDSIVRVIDDKLVLLRRGRGYAPLPVMMAHSGPLTLALGGHLKNTVCIGSGKLAFPSQHIGDLDTQHSIQTFKQTIYDLRRMYDLQPEFIVHDMHPDYASTRESTDMPGEKIAVQHHFSHILSCMAENNIAPPVLGFAWDGTGFGPDGTIWGGECLNVDESGYSRVGHFRTFSLPGGEAAVKQPWRTAVGLLYEMFDEKIDDFFHLPLFKQQSPGTVNVLLSILQKRVNCPRTSSAGRLFDAVASLLNVKQYNHYEGQAAMMLEHLAWKHQYTHHYPFDLYYDRENALWIMNWQPLLRAILEELTGAAAKERIAAGFHNTLAEIAVAAALKIQQERIALSGGTFQNRYLTERLSMRLKKEGFKVYTHQQIPPNDGGISLGQYYASIYYHKSKEVVCV